MKIRLEYTKELPTEFPRALHKALTGEDGVATRQEVKNFLARYGTRGAAELMRAWNKGENTNRVVRRGRGRPAKIEVVDVR